jgi:uncharacterized OB-fold protein
MLEPQDLIGTGILEAYATVHLHPGGEIETPFTIGVIALDGGPCIRATLTCEEDSGLRPGARVEARLVALGDSEELRFAPVNEGGNGT